MRGGIALLATLGLAVASAPAPVPAAGFSEDAMTASHEDRERAAECLATAIAYEAGYEPIEGQQAVAEVVLNRVHNRSFPKSVCGVIFAGSDRRTGCQFTFACDGALQRKLPDSIMAASRSVAEAALAGRNPSRVAGATHYHASYVLPYWASSLIRVNRINAHIFYRMPSAPSFGTSALPYVAVGEPLVRALRHPAPDGRAMAVTGGSPPTTVPPGNFAPWGLIRVVQ